MRKKSKSKILKAITHLSGKPLSETLSPSPILHACSGAPGEWVTSPDLHESGLSFTPETVYELSVFLLGNPHINSSILFRADILFDSLSVLRTPRESESSFAAEGNSIPEPSAAAATATAGAGSETEVVEPLPAETIPGFELTRTVVRRFIPRNPNLDRPLEQSCYFYSADEAVASPDSGDINNDGNPSRIRRKRLLVLYKPHADTKEDLPFYHPILRSLAYLYDFQYEETEVGEKKEGDTGTMSVHFLPYAGEPIHNRLERTLLSLLNTQIRLARGTRPSNAPDRDGNCNPVKDNIIPRHMVQDTYSRLKLKHADWLCRNWVEATEPSKHVFEDLAITAFVIELWRSMYGVVPADEREGEDQDGSRFPGFVDVACGNGVLVYVLLMEGYQGWGFDARHRKTWKVFPEHVQSQLKEKVYLPKPFLDEVVSSGKDHGLDDLGLELHTGQFPKDTFIISNHADELTVWTPLMAALANPKSPLPFLAIPCCSHSLSGARHRYPPSKGKKPSSSGPTSSSPEEAEQNPQPATGDLKALRSEKQEAQTDTGMLTSMYGCLTAKTMTVAEEVGYEVEKTLLRIPSTRNMGVLGGRRQVTREWSLRFNDRKQREGEVVSAKTATVTGDTGTGDDVNAIGKVSEVVRRECSREGGVEAAAKIWIEHAKGLNKGQGAGKQGGH